MSSWDEEIHDVMGESQGDPDAIDNIVDALQEGGAGVPKKRRPVTFGEVEKQLGARDVEPRADHK